WQQVFRYPVIEGFDQLIGCQLGYYRAVLEVFPGPEVTGIDLVRAQAFALEAVLQHYVRGVQRTGDTAAPVVGQRIAQQAVYVIVGTVPVVIRHRSEGSFQEHRADREVVFHDPGIKVQDIGTGTSPGDLRAL